MTKLWSEDGEENVLAYRSKTFTYKEWMYCVTFKELLSVILVSDRVKEYLFGRHFTIRSDHGSLEWIPNF